MNEIFTHNSHGPKQIRIKQNEESNNERKSLYADHVNSK